MFALYHETNVEGEDAVDTSNHVVVPNRRRQSGTTMRYRYYCILLLCMLQYTLMLVLLWTQV
jgi:hypothetical protein